MLLIDSEDQEQGGGEGIGTGREMVGQTLAETRGDLTLVGIMLLSLSMTLKLESK
jgi:hypothetical protein